MRYFKSFGMVVSILIIYAVVQFIAGFMVGMVFGIKGALIYGADDIDSLALYVEEKVLQNTSYILIIAALIAFLIFWLMDRKKTLQSAWKLRPIRIGHFLLMLLFGMASGIVLGMILSLISEVGPFAPTFEKYDQFAEQLFTGNWFVLLLSFGLVVPIIEEIMFRGMIMNHLNRVLRLPLAFVIQSILFGLYHFNPVQSTYAILLGLLITYLYLKYNSILAAIGVHIGINSFAVISTLEQVNNIFEQLALGFIIVAIGIFTAVLFWVGKRLAPIDWRQRPAYAEAVGAGAGVGHVHNNDDFDVDDNSGSSADDS